MPFLPTLTNQPILHILPILPHWSILPFLPNWSILPILTNRSILPIQPNLFHLNHKLLKVHYMSFYLVLSESVYKVPTLWKTACSRSGDRPYSNCSEQV